MNRPESIETREPAQPSISSPSAATSPYFNVRPTSPGTAPSLSVVSPCYNEQESLAELYRRLTEICRQQVGDDYEIVLVDDGSSDATRSIIRRYCEADPRMVGV